MSDWLGVYSTSAAINAGLDLEMPGPTRWRGPKLLEAIEMGEVTEETINDSARRVLTLIRRLGRIENPNEGKEISVAHNSSRDEFIRDGGAEGMVFLKNSNDIIPLPAPSDDFRVAMIGQFAHVASLGGGGSARVDSIRAVSPLEGMQKAGYKTEFSEGVPVFRVIPHAPASMIRETGNSAESQGGAVKVELFNGQVIGENQAHVEKRPTPEYMTKEQWPSYLDQDYA